jgi:hypothetical protein
MMNEDEAACPLQRKLDTPVVLPIEVITFRTGFE